ncbi:MAG: glycosyltransferase family A protein [Bacteroidota bacterium]|nr:glycosyltransferase family A protein [Bacteroidota bacterium]
MSEKLYIALPVLNETGYIEKFIDCTKKQTYKNFELWVCVNQPDYWWTEKDKIAICRNNVQTIEYLKSIEDIKVVILDKAGQGNGWDFSTKSCVGLARQYVMEKIDRVALNDDIIISLDADTEFSIDYFQTIVDNFRNHPKAIGLSVPYYHKLTGDEDLDRAILRYEIYMRYYAINMHRINSPYAFTALGSAMAVPVNGYRYIGGISPKNSGEDFYFIQKLAKSGELLIWNKERVYPAGRISDRVDFGTGPALKKGVEGDWKSYPIYDYRFFDEIGYTYDLLPELFENDLETPVLEFMSSKFKPPKFWQPMRNTHKNSKERFVRAVKEKIDGLRILQYLKNKQSSVEYSDEENLLNYLKKFHDNSVFNEYHDNYEVFSFSNSPVGLLNKLRDYLMNIEEHYQTKRD